MKTSCPRVVVAGTGSGVGKTSLTMALVLAFRRRGMRVRTFKVGPDFLDPSYLAFVSGQPCYNLDGWMSSRDYVLQRFAAATADADLAIIEGVMGMYDGASPTNFEGSTAEIAQWLQAPVLLVTGAGGVARSFAALVKGFDCLEPKPGVAAVVANGIGDDRHTEWLRESLASLSLPPLLGALPKACFPELKSRHLGLVTADYTQSLGENDCRAFADAAERHLDLDNILELARRAPPLEFDSEKKTEKTLSFQVRLAIARDAAFHFYYPDNIELLRSLGAEIIEFSPLADSALPRNVDAVYLGGGYPELSAEALSANESMRRAIREFADRGGAIYAECGGLIYLSASIACVDGKSYSMVGVLPVKTRMLSRLKRLGYVDLTLSAKSAWGSAGARIRGHEFHYSEILNPEALAGAGWQSDYNVQYRRAGNVAREGFRKKNVLASYIHVHFAARPDAAGSFLAWCRDHSGSAGAGA